MLNRQAADEEESFYSLKKKASSRVKRVLEEEAGCDGKAWGRRGGGRGGGRKGGGRKGGGCNSSLECLAGQTRLPLGSVMTLGKAVTERGDTSSAHSPGRGHAGQRLLTIQEISPSVPSVHLPELPVIRFPLKQS